MATPRDMRPRGSERAEVNAQKMDQFRSDPAVQEQADRAGEHVMRQYSEEPAPPRVAPLRVPMPDETPPAPRVPQRVAPPLSQPPMGQPTVPGEPQVRTRAGVRGGGGMPQRGPVPSPSAPPAVAPRQINPLVLSPGSPFKFAQGGMVQKHGSSTCVHSKTKHR